METEGTLQNDEFDIEEMLLDNVFEIDETFASD